MADIEEGSTKTWQDYLGIVYRHRRLICLTSFGVWLIIWAISWVIPSKYTSETVVLLERQIVPEQYVTSNVVTEDPTIQLQKMAQGVLSRPRLAKIIEDYHLYSKEWNKSRDLAVAAMRQDISISFVAPGTLPGNANNAATSSSAAAALLKSKDATAFAIDYSAPNPKVAQQINSQLTSLFIEENLQARQEQSESTTQFLENQLEGARKDLSEQEEKLRKYKAEYLGQLPEQLQGNVQILSGLQGRLQAENEALSHAQQQKVYLQSLLNDYKTGNGPGKDEELDKLRAQLADLKARYTSNHPDVIHLTNQIAELESAKHSSESSDTTGHTSEAAMQVSSQLKANELEIAERQREVKDIESQIESYQARMYSTPLREQQLAEVTRNHDQSQNNYDALLAKKMQSELASNLEKRQQGEQFRIIDPPSLPDKPASPHRPKLSLLGLVLGLGLACVGVVATEFTDDSIRSEKEIKSLLPVNVLSEIPALLLPRDMVKQRRQALLEWGLAICMLLIIIGGNIYAVLDRLGYV